MNENNNDDKDNIRLNHYLKIEKDNMIFMNSWKKREMTWEKMTLDMNNVLTLFIDLLMINIEIMILIIVILMKNLKKSVHIIYNDISLH